MGARMNLSNSKVYKGKFQEGIWKENFSELNASFRSRGSQFNEVSSDRPTFEFNLDA